LADRIGPGADCPAISIDEKSLPWSFQLPTQKGSLGCESNLKNRFFTNRIGCFCGMNEPIKKVGGECVKTGIAKGGIATEV
jgi:hypothetical protein